MLVAAPYAVTVVAVVLNTDSVALSVTTLVENVGLVPKTSLPEPVSSEITPASCAEVVAAKSPSVLPVVASVPAASGNVIVRFAVSVAVASVTAKLDVPPARPSTMMPSCVAAGRNVWPVPLVNVFAAVKAFAVPR